MLRIFSLEFARSANSTPLLCYSGVAGIADRIAMGVPNHDTIRTDHTVVTENVDFVIHLTTARQLSVDFWIMGEAHKAKPAENASHFQLGVCATRKLHTFIYGVLPQAKLQAIPA
jgi:hypothetical protein